MLAPALRAPLLATAPLLARAALAAALVNLFGLFASVFAMTVYDRVAPAGAVASLAVLSAGMAIVLVFDWLMRRERAHLIDIAGARLELELAAALFERLLAHPLDGRRGAAGAYAGALRDVDTLREVVSAATLVGLVDLPFSALFLAAAALIGGPLALVPLAMFPVALGAAALAAHRLARGAEAAGAGVAARAALLTETVGALETARAVGAGPFLSARFAAASDAHVLTGLRTRAVAGAPVIGAQVLQALAYAAVVAVGALLVAEGASSMGAVVATSMLAARAVAPLAGASGLVTRLAHARTAADALGRLLSVAAAAPSVVSETRGFVLEAVEYRYAGAATPTVGPLTLAIAPGERVAVLGRNGSGKTTLLRLLAGLVDPSSGRIARPGPCPGGATGAPAVALAPQEVRLFAASIEENIALGRPGVGPEAVRAAAALAGLDRVVATLPGGYAHPLDDRGAPLTGGNRQALALARALAGRPAALLLDEPTSAFDQLAEAALIERLPPGLSGVTVVMVTHRAALLALATRVIVMEGGRIVVDQPREVFQSGANAPVRASGVARARGLDGRGDDGAPAPAAFGTPTRARPSGGRPPGAARSDADPALGSARTAADPPTSATA